MKGEMIILIEGNSEVEEDSEITDMTIEEQYNLYEKQGFSKMK